MYSSELNTFHQSKSLILDILVNEDSFNEVSKQFRCILKNHGAFYALVALLPPVYSYMYSVCC
uniref:Uncharacterized protein n=1 Tax=Arundo donax TaxID=35708 RepID=A0A0A9U1X2_ARUDO